MNKTEYATMSERERTYWWHLGRLRILENYTKRAFKDNKPKKARLLNVGCGTGGTIDMLEQFGAVDNVDISDEAIRFMKQAGYSRLKKVKDIKLPYKDRTFDVVTAFDVLEHIDQDIAALREWARVLKDDGSIVISVPAYQWLWSDHDVSLHHKRRYTIKSLMQVATKAGLHPKRKTYAIVFSLPLVVGFRFMNKLLGRKTDSETSYVNLPSWLNSLFTKFLYAEAAVHKVVSLPVGTSVVTILRKKQ